MNVVSVHCVLANLFVNYKFSSWKLSTAILRSYSRYKSFGAENGQKLWVKFPGSGSAKPLKSCNKRSLSALLFCAPFHRECYGWGIVCEKHRTLCKFSSRAGVLCTTGIQKLCYCKYDAKTLSTFLFIVNSSTYRAFYTFLCVRFGKIYRQMINDSRMWISLYWK